MEISDRLEVLENSTSTCPPKKSTQRQAFSNQSIQWKYLRAAAILLEEDRAFSRCGEATMVLIHIDYGRRVAGAVFGPKSIRTKISVAVPQRPESVASKEVKTFLITSGFYSKTEIR